jgi:DNA polymerase III alpha subunit
MLSLHNHSNNTLLCGTIPPEKLIAFAKKYGSPYCALTDTNNMYGLIQFAKKAAQENVKPLLGALIDEQSDRSRNAIFIARNNNGYSKLCKIITSRKLNDRFSLSALINSGLNDLYIITSSLSLLKDIKDSPFAGENVFAELIVTARRKKLTRELYEFAAENHIQIIASNPAYFENPEDYILHKVVSAIRLNKTLASLHPEELVDEEYYLKRPDEIKSLWRALPEAVRNSERIADECNVNLSLGKYKFPEFPLPEGETAYSYLWKICFKGLSEKYKPITEIAVKRLQYELEVIDELGFTDYFLVVRDIVHEARRRRMMSIGRGSAANSLVAYCLDFTQIDPIKHNLYFERFLNRGRISPPDVDLDFSWRERDEIVKYVFDKYGYDKVAMISATITFRARSALREVAKVFGISEIEISKYSKLIPWTSAKNLEGISEKFPETKDIKFDSEPWKTIVHIASRLADFPRHRSIHPSGIVVAPGTLSDYTAMEYAKNKGLGLIVTQPDMYSIEDLGLIKIDLLSQRSLGVLRDTLGKLERSKKGNEQQGKSTKIFRLGNK